MDYGSGGRLCTEEMSSRGVWDDSIMESRFCGQVENGTPSTSPPYWDTDDDDDGGPKPSALYGKFTWKIEKFSQINKRELRSNAFEVGGYKWYILIYPQGCDVCNHLSLFLCVANHDKLLPGWSHFAQFTIAVVNKDPKKSKYSDTLHRFCKKEHDWGWKKFIEISKVFDGFVNDDSLIIKAQVQVIREKANHPFRCLDCQYRRELVRVYLSNVEQICRRFIEDRKGKLCKLIDDKMRWSSFRAFWLGMDEKTRDHMSREKTDNILKVVVKNFFVEKEVTSTLVMDSLYSGLKALESQSRSKFKKGKMKLVEGEEKLPAPVVYSENNMFVLSEDVLVLVDIAALGPIPLQPLNSKNDKSSLNCTKDANSGEEFNKDIIERDERRLTEFGLKTLEFYILFHIFSKIDVAHKEAVALKRQEELIKEEEAAELAEIELKAKRSAADKEKRAKKKQAKQRRNRSKIKEKMRDELANIIFQGKHMVQSSADEYLYEESSTNQEEHIIEKNSIEENASETSDTAYDLAESTQPDREENSVTNALEINSGIDVNNNNSVQYEPVEKYAAPVIDDSSSTCSSETIPSVLMNGSYEGNSVEMSRSLNRGKNQMDKDTFTKPSEDRSTRPESEIVNLLNERKVKEEQINIEESTSPTKEVKVEANKTNTKQSIDSKTYTHSSRQIPNHASENAPASTQKKTYSSNKDSSNATKVETVAANQASLISRPYSAPLIPPQRPSNIPVLAQTSSSSSSSSLSRSISAAGRLGTDPFPSLPTSASPPFIPHSYRNAITGTNDISATRPVSFAYPHPSLNQTHSAPGFTFSSVSYQNQDEPDEFPHMDIIYDLLDEERVTADEATMVSADYYHNYSYHNVNEQAGQYYGRAHPPQLNQWPPPYALPEMPLLTARDDGCYGYQLSGYTNGENGYTYNARLGSNNAWPQNGL